LFTDARSGRIALVAHCILNQNAKVAEYAVFPAMVPGFCELMERFAFGVHQLPCPEMCTAGIRRWWQVSEQYGTAAFRRSYTRLADSVLDQIEDFLQAGFSIVLIGVDGSPSCGIDITDTDPSWMGSPTVRLRDPEEYLRKGSGVFIDCLRRRAAERGFPQFPSIGLPLDVKGKPVDLSVVETFLKGIKGGE